MSIASDCCGEGTISRCGTSPLSDLIAFGYEDGPTIGLVRCGACGREYRFEWLGESDVEGVIRIYHLAPVPIGSMEKFTRAMEPHQAPRFPRWVPTWEFASETERQEMDDLVDRIMEQAGPVDWVLACAGGPTADALASWQGVDGNGPDQHWFERVGVLKHPV